MIEIDGSYGLGSGQLTRLALIFSVLTEKDLHIKNIRQGRNNPGLKAQHMHAVKALEKICDAKSEGVNIGSKEIWFYPGKLKGGNIEIDIGTAGSITLLLQNLLVPLLFCKKQTRLLINGGTDVEWSPQIDYLKNVILPFFKPYTKNIELNILKRGYYPKGGGQVELIVEPQLRKKPLNFLEQGKINLIKGNVHASNSLKKAEVCERMIKGCKEILKDYKFKIDISYFDSYSDGCGICLWVETDKTIIGADELGKKGVKAEIVGFECGKKLLYEINSECAIDQHMADNLIPLLALFGGKIKTSIVTEHTKTAIWVCEQFLDVKFKIKDRIIGI